MTQPRQRPLPGFTPFLATVCLTLMLTSCAEYDKSVGKNLVGGARDGVIREMFLPVTQSTTYTEGDRVKFSSTQLQLGEMDGFHSDMIFWFTSYTNLGEVLRMDSVQLHLWSAGYLDPERIDPASQWRAELLRVDDSSYDPITGGFVSAGQLAKTPLDTALLGTVDADLDTFEVHEFSLELDTLDLDTLLLYIRPLDQADFIKKFVPYSSVSAAENLPRLFVSGDFVISEDTLRDTTLTVNPIYATFYTDDNGFQLDADHLVLSQSFVRSVLAMSDFTVLDPKHQSLNRVDLVLTADGDWDGKLGSPTSVTWYDNRSEWEAEPDTVEFGLPSALSYFIPDTTQQLRFNITPVARKWVAAPETNFGVAIRSVIAGNAIARRAFFSSAASVDPDLRPYFHVIYTDFEQP